MADQKINKWRAQTYAVPGSVGYKALEIALQNLKAATLEELTLNYMAWEPSWSR